MTKWTLVRDTNLYVAVPAVLVVLAVMAIGLLAAQPMADALSQLRTLFRPVLAWYLPALVTVILFIVVWLGLGRYRSVRLGGDRESPEFGTGAWLSMLFAVGTGVGLLFWSVAEPLLHFDSNPFANGDEPKRNEAVIAIRLTFLHWGLTGWAIFGILGLILAYFGFRKGLPLTARAALYPIAGRRIHGWLGHVVDVFAVLATVFGVVTTLGLGVKQMNTGLNWLLGTPDALPTQIVIIAVITGVALVSIVMGVGRGTRRLSQLNIILSLLMLGILLLAGPTFELLSLAVQATGAYFQNLIAMNLWTGYEVDSDWQSKWTIFFWGWWIAWSPFVSMFIARISRGRTIREYVFGVLLVPSLISFAWIAILGGNALDIQESGSVDLISAVQENVAIGLFETIGALSIPQWLITATVTLVLVIIAIYLITSVDPSTLVITTLTSGGSLNPLSSQRAAWGVANATLTGILLAVGGVQALQDAVVAASLPFSLVLIAMMVGLIQALRREPYSPRRGYKHQEDSPMEASR